MQYERCDRRWSSSSSATRRLANGWNVPVRAELLLALALFPACLYGQFTGDGPTEAVIGSLHDLRQYAKGNTEKMSACDYCHTKVEDVAGDSPLEWNRKVKMVSFTPYASATFNAGDLPGAAAGSGAMTNNANATLMCLSCHDGAVAHRDMETNIPEAGPQRPLDLSGDHPVHFVYSYQLTGTHLGLQPPVEGIRMRIPYVGRRTSLPLYKDSPDDASGRMECATCHNPHDGTSRYFLRMPNTGSALCLNCH